IFESSHFAYYIIVETSDKKGLDIEKWKYLQYFDNFQYSQNKLLSSLANCFAKPICVYVKKGKHFQSSNEITYLFKLKKLNVLC
ncbi:hypothetical protein RFI_36484, partial [Reticulomyxa filosa]